MKLHLIVLIVLGLLSACAPKLGNETIVLPDDSKPQSSPLPSTNSHLDYASPLSQASILSRFGEQGSGMILRTSEPGEAVFAVQDGLVTEMSKFSANDGYIVTIEHANKLSTSYLNLQAVPLVKVGDRVKKHQVIGYLGGGSLTPANVLKFFASQYHNGQFSFIDPASLILFN